MYLERREKHGEAPAGKMPVSGAAMKRRNDKARSEASKKACYCYESKTSYSNIKHICTCFFV